MSEIVSEDKDICEAASRDMNARLRGPRCSTPNCKNYVAKERNDKCKYCEDCMYERMGDFIEQHPIGGGGIKR